MAALQAAIRAPDAAPTPGGRRSPGAPAAAAAKAAAATAAAAAAAAGPRSAALLGFHPAGAPWSSLRAENDRSDAAGAGATLAPDYPSAVGDAGAKAPPDRRPRGSAAYPWDDLPPLPTSSTASDDTLALPGTAAGCKQAYDRIERLAAGVVAAETECGDGDGAAVFSRLADEMKMLAGFLWLHASHIKKLRPLLFTLKKNELVVRDLHRNTDEPPYRLYYQLQLSNLCYQMLGAITLFHKQILRSDEGRHLASCEPARTLLTGAPASTRAN